MMKTNTPLKIEMPRKRTRAHVVLFCADTPFKPKVVESKIAYRRKPKHSKSQLDF
jgi:hypothetical protein